MDINRDYGCSRKVYIILVASIGLLLLLIVMFMLAVMLNDAKKFLAYCSASNSCALYLNYEEYYMVSNAEYVCPHAGSKTTENFGDNRIDLHIWNVGAALTLLCCLLRGELPTTLMTIPT